MKIVTAEFNCPIMLGERGENLATRVQFPIAEMVELYGEGTFRLLAQRNGEEPYPVSITSDESFVYWDVTAADTSIEGTGYAELQLVINEVLAKSQTYTTKTMPALGAEGEVPEPQQGWIDEVYDTIDQKIADAEDVFTEIKNAAQQAAADAHDEYLSAKEKAEAAADSATAAQQAADRIHVHVVGNELVVTVYSEVNEQ